VIRAGYGMAFDTISSFQVTAVAGSVPGLTITCSAIPGGAVTPGCAPVPDLRIAQASFRIGDPFREAVRFSEAAGATAAERACRHRL